MGICYKLILEDEWDWDLKTLKDERLLEFESKFGRYIERIAEWRGCVVYDIDKASPFDKNRRELIREYADRAYYMDDMGTGITELDLPKYKPSDLNNLEAMDARRTYEQKKASEAIAVEKLKKMELG